MHCLTIEATKSVECMLRSKLQIFVENEVSAIQFAVGVTSNIRERLQSPGAILTSDVLRNVPPKLQTLDENEASLEREMFAQYLKYKNAYKIQSSSSVHFDSKRRQ